MWMQTALMILATYLMAGGVFALVFHLRGLHSIDPATEGAGMAFRLLITPGIRFLATFRGWDMKEG